MSINLSQWGLISDIFGVVLLFIYGLPSKFQSVEGSNIITESVPEKELAEIKRRNKNIRRVLMLA